jgi:hypothetical protein
MLVSSSDIPWSVARISFADSVLALKPVLIAEKVYRDLCTSDEIEKDVSVCEGQELR